MDLSVRLEYTAAGVAPIRYAIKADSVTINLQKTPIQIPVPQNTPQLVDFGIFRPSITLSALVDTVGGNQSETATGYEGMDKITIVQGTASSTGSPIDYYIPYKNKLEENLYQWVADDENTLWLYIGDHRYPVYNQNFGDGGTTAYGIGTDEGGTGNNWSTGGAVYSVALQQARFQMDAGREDRWICQMQFVSKARRDVTVRLFGGQ